MLDIPVILYQTTFWLYIFLIPQQEEDEGIDVSSSSAYNNERNRTWGPGSGGGPFVYQLFSIMIHSGSASGGHYYAYIKDFTTGEWFCFNDQSVTKASWNTVPDQQ